MKRTRLKQKSDSENSLVKERIQGLVRDIVILRDGGCVLRYLQDFDGDKRHLSFSVPRCNSYAKDGHLVLQADHLITRSNSATFSDTRLIVCICRGHHGWKKWNEQRYNEIVRNLLSSDRVSLWDRCHAARYKPTRMGVSDWLKEEAALKQELARIQKENPVRESVVNY